MDRIGDDNVCGSRGISEGVVVALDAADVVVVVIAMEAPSLVVVLILFVDIIDCDRRGLLWWWRVGSDMETDATIMVLVLVGNTVLVGGETIVMLVVNVIVPGRFLVALRECVLDGVVVLKL